MIAKMLRRPQAKTHSPAPTMATVKGQRVLHKQSKPTSASITSLRSRRAFVIACSTLLMSVWPVLKTIENFSFNSSRLQNCKSQDQRLAKRTIHQIPKMQTISELASSATSTSLNRYESKLRQRG